MDIAALSMSLASNNVMQQASIAVMNIAKEQVQQSGTQVVNDLKALNVSLDPNVGRNIDVSI